MSKLFLSSLLVFQALCLLLCAGQRSEAYKEEHFFESFFDTTNIPSVFAVEEKLYIDGYKNITNVHNTLERIEKESNENFTDVYELGEVILGKIPDLNVLKFVNVKRSIFSEDVDIFFTENGYYRQLGYFYINRYSDSDFYLGKRIFQTLDEFYKEAKEMQASLATRNTLLIYCDYHIPIMLNVWIATAHDSFSDRYLPAMMPTFDSVVDNCGLTNPKTKALLDDLKGNLRKKASIFLRNSMYLYFDKMSFALDFSTYGSFSGQQSAPKGAQLGTLELMLYETNQAGHEIQKSLETLQRKKSSSAEAKTLYESFEYILNGSDPDWNLYQLYSPTPGDIVYNQQWAKIREDGVSNLKLVVLPTAKAYMEKFRSLYRYNITAFMNDTDETHWENFKETYFEPLKYTYDKGFVTQFKLVEGTTNFFVESGGDTNFIKNALATHNLLLSWKGLKRFNAKIKCHLKNTYWGVHRNKALKASQQPLWRIFGGVSKTLYEPCVHNDTDLVGTCTAANHEICMPIKYSEYMMRKLDEDDERAQYYLKPEPVFLPNKLPNGTVECKELETYVPPMNVCRCGFRLDCGVDLGKNLTCVLQAEDNFRKRCRGGIGYPCKTLPLGPGRHHESCVTGYCNMRLNSCEYDDKQYPIVWSGVHRDDEI